MRRRFSIATILSAGIATLVLVAVGTVLVVALKIALRNTTDLLEDNIAMMIDSLQSQVAEHLFPAKAQADYLAMLIAQGYLNPADHDQFAQALTVSNAAIPQVASVTYLDSDDMQALRVARDITQGGPHVEDWDEEKTRRSLDIIGRSDDSFWGRPFRAPETGKTLLNVRTPVRRDGEFLGAILTSVTIDKLSTFIGDIRTTVSEIPFILYGDLDVLAHPALIERNFPTSDDDPLPTVEDIGDTVLANLWDPQKSHASALVHVPGMKVHIIDGDNDQYVAMFQRLYGYGELPWIIGVYFPLEQVEEPVSRLETAAISGLVFLLLAIVLALLMARRFSGPLQRLADAALELKQSGPFAVHKLPDSPIREVAFASAAFNEMTEGLRQGQLIRETFGKYVPRAVAAKLLEEKGKLQAETGTATILFTDIQGFSTLSEKMAPADIITTLNDYFTAITEPIERYSGVINQFQGDAILATFNLPVPDTEHAAKAVQAALEIQDIVRERRFGGGHVLPTRVGINTGTVVGGAVGSGDRLGYTVHGDDVNLAARIQELNKKFGTYVLVTQSSAVLCADVFDFEAVGEAPIRGRVGHAKVYVPRPRKMSTEEKTR